MSSEEDVVIDVRHLQKRYEIYPSPRARLKQLIIPGLIKRVRSLAAKFGIQSNRSVPQYFQEFWALNDVSFQVRRGETFGIIGKNGSGKSTLLQLLAGTLSPTSGEVTVNGRVAALLELGSGFNPEFTGRENVFLNARILGLSQKEIEERFDQILDFADIGEFIDQPVKTYSSGMFVRLAFAVQAHINASIVIIDEALAVGDVFFRQKCYARLEQLRKSGAAILLVSHSMPDIEQYCDRALLLHSGIPKFIGTAPEAAKRYYLLDQTSKNLVKVVSEEIFDISQLDSEGETENVSFNPVKNQVTNGQANCVEIATYNRAGELCASFKQGDIAIFLYKFHMLDALEVPICGMNISNERGVIVHGKNSWQSNSDAPLELKAGVFLTCVQEVKLDIAPGEYVYEVGLSSISASVWGSRDSISHEAMSSMRTRICHVPNAGSFSVHMIVNNGVQVLPHHGLTNLGGKIRMISSC